MSAIVNSTSDDILGVMRGQAWERVKGEIGALLAAYVSRGDEQMKARFSRMIDLSDEFIRAVEDEGLAE